MPYTPASSSLSGLQGSAGTLGTLSSLNTAAAQVEQQLAQVLQSHPGMMQQYTVQPVEHPDHVLVPDEKPSDPFLALAHEATLANIKLQKLQSELEEHQSLIDMLKTRLRLQEDKHADARRRAREYQDQILTCKEKIRELLVTETQILREIEDEYDPNSRCSDEPALQETKLLRSPITCK